MLRKTYKIALRLNLSLNTYYQIQKEEYFRENDIIIVKY